MNTECDMAHREAIGPDLKAASMLEFIIFSHLMVELPGVLCT